MFNARLSPPPPPPPRNKSGAGLVRPPEYPVCQVGCRWARTVVQARLHMFVYNTTENPPSTSLCMREAALHACWRQLIHLKGAAVVPHRKTLCGARRAADVRPRRQRKVVESSRREGNATVCQTQNGVSNVETGALYISPMSLRINCSFRMCLNVMKRVLHHLDLYCTRKWESRECVWAVCGQGAVL